MLLVGVWIIGKRTLYAGNEPINAYKKALAQR